MKPSPKDIINYHKVSDAFGVHKESIRRNKCPKKYKAKMNELEIILTKWLSNIDNA